MEEVRWYLGIILLAVGAITVDIAGSYATLGEALRHAVFQVGSVITTTGFATADYDLWPGFSKTMLVTLMFIGACAGSTGGGIKVSRVLILYKTFRKERKLHLHPQRVTMTAIDDKIVPQGVVRSTNVFIVAYVFIFFWSLLLISLNEFDFTTNVTAVLATLNNIGPGLADVGPTRNFSQFSDFSKLVLIFDMLAGRLELFPLLMLFSRETWKKF
jgi:trk system potassium uptake protein TrkH